MSPSDTLSFIEIITSSNLGYLGVCVTILISAGGFFYLFNLRPFQKNIEKQEEQIASIKKDIDEKILSMDIRFTELARNQSNEIKDLIDNTIEKVEILKVDIEEKSALSEKKSDELINKVEKDLRFLKNKNQESELNTLWNEHYMWSGMQIHENELVVLIDYMEKAVDYNKLTLKDLWADQVLEVLNKIKKPSTDRKIHPKLVTLLDKLQISSDVKDNIKIVLNRLYSNPL